jgi:hypothetical protein
MEEIEKPVDGSQAAKEPATSPPTRSDRKEPARRSVTALLAFLIIAIAFLAIALYLIKVINGMPTPARTFVALCVAAGALVVGGLVTLIVIIPAAGSRSDVKTEFYSARAAYLCVIAGLALFGIVAIGAVFARVMLNVGRR